MIYEADTETTKNEDGSMRVWLADLCEIADGFRHETFRNLDDFMQYLFNERGETVVYFHNWKFDGSYILNWANDNGFVFSQQKNEPNTYNVLVTDMSVWFCGSITNDFGKTITFRDSLKKIPLPVRKIAKAYGTPMLKGEIDYNSPRPIGYEPTPEEIAYIRNDTEIVARALKIHFDRGMNAMTAPADSMHEFKTTVNFESLFVPKYYISHRNVEQFCRKAYSGGISWVNPRTQTLVKGKHGEYHYAALDMPYGLVYDYNSMYPSVMLAYPFPTGYPVRWLDRPPEGYDLFIAHVKVLSMDRKPYCPACIRDPSNHTWIEGHYEGELWLTSVDLELLEMAYEYEYDADWGYAWKGTSHIFDEFIEHWARIKRESAHDDPNRQIAKLMLNSLYGKFGTNPEKISKSPYFDSDGILHFSLNQPTYAKTGFSVAVAAFVTAYARRELIRGAMQCKGIVCYMDTDSLHICADGKTPPAFTGRVHDSDFCAWKKESEFVRARYLRQKTYIEQQYDGSYNIAACGCPESAKKFIDFDNFQLKQTFPGKLSPRMRKGGVELVETTFTIKAPFTW